MPVNPVFKIFVRNKEAVVRPPSDIAETINVGDVRKVTFKNRTKDKAILHLPGGVFVGHNKKFTVVLDERGGASPDQTLNVDGTADTEVFSYQVYCAQTQTFAIGNSDPEFIIDP